jgi:uridine phosphorylase
MPILNPEHAYKEYVPSIPAGETFATHHIKALPSEISRYCFIPGSHLRGRKIAEQLENCKVVSATRGYYIYSGYSEGVFLTVCSTGMGGPVVAIAMEELHRLGVDTFIRVGSAGAGQDYLGVGDIAISTGVIRAGGTSYNFLPASFPAVPDFDLTLDMKLAADELGIKTYTGVTSAGDAFYAPKDAAQRDLFKKAGLIAMEMESDTEFIVGSFNGWRCAGGFVLDGGNAKKIQNTSAKGMVIANHADNSEFIKGEDDLIRLSIKAMVRCAKRDAAAAK